MPWPATVTMQIRKKPWILVRGDKARIGPVVSQVSPAPGTPTGGGAVQPMTHHDEVVGLGLCQS
jgi:hypothetical protein